MSGASPGAKKKFRPTFSFALKLLGIMVLLCIIVFLLKKYDVTEMFDQEGERPYSVSQQEPAASENELPNAPTSEWQRVIAPAAGGDWSSWIQIPMGHTIRFCDTVKDPSCSAADFSDAEFSLQCRDRTNDNPVDWAGDICLWSDANRVRSNADEPRTIQYRFERAS